MILPISDCSDIILFPDYLKEINNWNKTTFRKLDKCVKSSVYIIIYL